MALIGMKRRDHYEVIVVCIICILFPLFSISINFVERLHNYFRVHSTPIVTEYLINFVFLYLVGLLYLTYRRWKKAEKKRQELEHVIANINPDAIIVVDPDRNITMCNPSIQRIFGHSVDAILNKKTDFLYLDRRRNPQKSREIYEVLEKEGFHIGLATGKKANGGTVPLEIITWGLSDNGGAVLLLRDIGDRIGAEKALRESLKKLQKTLNGTVTALATTGEMRDPYTAGHQRRVAQLACAIAAEMGFSEDRIEGIQVMGFLHDIGKIVVPSEILSKPSKLTDYEFNMIKAHSQAGYDILKGIEFPWPVAQGAYQHHERLNGSGYPSKLKGDDILEEAKILSVADVVEAMASHRPYRPGLGIDKALEEITKNKGILYDLDIAEACLKLFRERGFEFQ